MAKKDNKGNLITGEQALKKLYLNTFVERLEHRKQTLERAFCCNKAENFKTLDLKRHNTGVKISENQPGNRPQ